MAGEVPNKVIYNGNTIMDISDSTVEEGDVSAGKVFYKANGVRSIGSGSGMFKVTFTLAEEDGEYTVTCDQTFTDISTAIEDGQFIDAILIDTGGLPASLEGFYTEGEDGDIQFISFCSPTIGATIGMFEEDGNDYIDYYSNPIMYKGQYCDEFGNINEAVQVINPYVAVSDQDQWINTKTANCNSWTATPNSYVYVLMRVANTYNGKLYLNINETGSNPIYINGTVSSSSNKTLPAGSYLVFYDGTNYYFRTDGKLPATTEKAVADGSGNVITTTYATKSELPTTVSSLTNDAGYITLADIPPANGEGF